MVATVCLSNDEDLKGEKRRSAFSALTERKRKGCRVRVFRCSVLPGTGCGMRYLWKAGRLCDRAGRQLHTMERGGFLRPPIPKEVRICHFISIALRVAAGPASASIRPIRRSSTPAVRARRVQRVPPASAPPARREQPAPQV